MSREFPRFLFSNPTNTKSKGPFVVHTLDPYFIVRVEKTPSYTKPKNLQKQTTNGKFLLTFLTEVQFSEKLDEVTEKLYLWLNNNKEVKDLI